MSPAHRPWSAAEANLGLLGPERRRPRGHRGRRSRSTAACRGVTHLYLAPAPRRDSPSTTGVLHVNVARDGRILIVNNQLVPGLAAAVNASSPP